MNPNFVPTFVSGSRLYVRPAADDPRQHFCLIGHDTTCTQHKSNSLTIHNNWHAVVTNFFSWHSMEVQKTQVLLLVCFICSQSNQIKMLLMTIALMQI